MEVINGYLEPLDSSDDESSVESQSSNGLSEIFKFN